MKPPKGGPEFKRGPAGAEFCRVIIENAIGKTIERLWFGPDKSTVRDVHQGERLVLYFTDGTSLELMLGSGLGGMKLGNGLHASDVNLSFIPVFHEP